MRLCRNQNLGPRIHRPKLNKRQIDQSVQSERRCLTLQYNFRRSNVSSQPSALWKIGFRPLNPWGTWSEETVGPAGGRPGSPDPVPGPPAVHFLRAFVQPLPFLTRPFVHASFLAVADVLVRGPGIPQAPHSVLDAFLEELIFLASGTSAHWFPQECPENADSEPVGPVCVLRL